jgi:hypothetical protein
MRTGKTENRYNLLRYCILLIYLILVKYSILFV